MHLKIKLADNSLLKYYVNHKTFHEGDAGFDIYVPHEYLVMGRKMCKIDTGIACEAWSDDRKTNISFFTFPRSSITRTPLRLANSVGIIDKGYRGNLFGCFDNISENSYRIEAGIRLLQICSPNLEPITYEIVDTLTDTTRGTGGFGSTGQ